MADCVNIPYTPMPGDTVQPIIVSRPPMLGSSSVGPKPMQIICPSCQQQIRTVVTHNATTKTHLTALCLIFVCCCCWIPYCMNSCRNANHYCSNCNAFIGTYNS